VLARVERQVVVDAERIEEGAVLEDEGKPDAVSGRLKRGIKAVDRDRAGGRSSRPAMWRRSTLLPEPLGPMRTKISLGWTSNVMSLSTSTPA